MLGSKYKNLYSDYYADGSVSAKRTITAKQTVDHIVSLMPTLKGMDILDVGSGDGAVLEEMSNMSLGENYSAIDISESGVEAIKARCIEQLKEALLFDGYEIPYPDDTFDLAMAIHVVEHVEHERLFLQELARVAKQCYVEVPLEHTLRVKRAINISGPHGHINFYTSDTFRNLLETTGLVVENMNIFPHNKEMETFLSGRLKGNLKYFARSSALKLAQRPATDLLVYMCGAVVRKA